jgi:hypothetical protein
MVFLKSERKRPEETGMNSFFPQFDEWLPLIADSPMSEPGDHDSDNYSFEVRPKFRNFRWL